MNAPGKGLLKTVSILFIIFGAIATIVSIIAFTASAALTSVAGELGGDVGAALGGILLVATVIMLIASVLMLVIGIMGVGKKSNDPTKAGFYIVTGIILCILELISLVLGLTNGSFQWTGLVGFVLPDSLHRRRLYEQESPDGSPVRTPDAISASALIKKIRRWEPADFLWAGGGATHSGTPLLRSWDGIPPPPAGGSPLPLTR